VNLHWLVVLEVAVRDEFVEPGDELSHICLSS
jgi:hypothetical protein